MFKISAQLMNVTYHPILDNYKQFENVTKTPFERTKRFGMVAALDLGKISISVPKHNFDKN